MGIFYFLAGVLSVFFAVGSMNLVARKKWKLPAKDKRVWDEVTSMRWDYHFDFDFDVPITMADMGRRIPYLMKESADQEPNLEKVTLKPGRYRVIIGVNAGFTKRSDECGDGTG